MVRKLYEVVAVRVLLDDCLDTLGELFDLYLLEILH